MLKNIPKIISPELMSVLMRMGHGDEIVFADANFPAESYNNNVIRMDSVEIPDLLEAILPFITLDDFVDDAVKLMQVVIGHGEQPEIWNIYKKILENCLDIGEFKGFAFLERNEFYNQTKEAFSVVITGTTARYANITIKKGVIDL